MNIESVNKLVNCYTQNYQTRVITHVRFLRASSHEKIRRLHPTVLLCTINCKGKKIYNTKLKRFWFAKKIINNNYNNIVDEIASDINNHCIPRLFGPYFIHAFIIWWNNNVCPSSISFSGLVKIIIIHVLIYLFVWHRRVWTQYVHGHVPSNTYTRAHLYKYKT